MHRLLGGVAELLKRRFGKPQHVDAVHHPAGQFEQLEGQPVTAARLVLFHIAELRQRSKQAVNGAFVQAGCAGQLHKRHSIRIMRKQFDQSECTLE